MKRLVYAGARRSEDGFTIDYRYNYPEDLIHIEEPQLYGSVHDNDIYYFGYRFNDSASSKDRTEFIRSVKQIGDNPLTDDQLDQFIKRPLKYLHQKVNIYTIDCMVYPLSNRSPLVTKMIRAINDMTSHEMRRCSFDDVLKGAKSPQGSTILVVDDINTTGSTLHEILRKLMKINSDCEIFVYTLIGK